MDMTLAERAQAVVRFLAKKTGRKQFEIARDLGYTNKSAFSAVMNGKSPVPKQFPQKLASLDPCINIDFLTGSSDEMLLPGYDSPSIPDTGGHQTPPPTGGPGVWLPIELVRMFTDMSATIRSQQETIRALLHPTESHAEKEGAASL